MQNLQVLAVEDERIHQANIKSLARSLDFQLTDIVSEVPQAIESFKVRKPDLVLMDLHLNAQHDGLELAKEFRNIYSDIPIIFTTSKQDEAGFSAVKDAGVGLCLSKPLEEDVLRMSIENSVRSLREQFKKNELETSWPVTKPHSFFVRIGNRLKRIETRKIEYIEVEEKYCAIALEGRQIHVKIALKDFLKKLPVDNFIRVHRNFVVNADFIQSIQLNENIVVLDSKEVPVSRTYKEDLIDRLNLL
jgi:DNA-binding LytR/AlgR family response regulator